ncbi:MAG: DNA repair protein RecN, partial [Gemmatimonadales bacterium]
GDRADRSAIRSGATKVVIEGVVDPIPDRTRAAVAAAGIEVDDHLVLRREITAEGRSRAWINGSPATIGTLARVGEGLVDLHGQHQTIELVEPVTQRALLDAFGSAEPAARAAASAFDRLAEARAGYTALVARRDDAQRRADWLRHVVAEIDAAHPRPGEEEVLAGEANRLSQSGALVGHAAELVGAIDDEDTGARTALGRAEHAFHALERIDPSLAEWRELIDAAYTALDELARRAVEYQSTLSDDPERRADVERRRDLLRDLRRKHGESIAAVLEVRDAAHGELDLLDTAELDLRALAAAIAGAERGWRDLAAELTAMRAAAADRLAKEVSRLLPRLGLTGAQFSVELAPLAEPGRDGAESVTFVVRLNRGMEPRPLARVASGGELSRLMLALKVVLAREDAVPCLVFDEIDQGIGGEVGSRVGGALARVAAAHQVLVITHLPQIAARADHHLRIAKATRGGLATSDVAVLHGEDRVLELARMLGDADSDAARRLAVALINAPVSA